MLESFKKYIKQHCLISKNDKILLGISGGIDSMCMLNIFKKANINIAVAHCNFSLRGNESDMDEEFVKASAGNTTFHTTRFDTNKYAKENNVSIQMAARELRYNWFEKLIKENNYSSLAVAHNKNDIVETFFINLLRGTGIKGLTGIQPKAGNVIRPLLFAERKDIERYIKKHNIQYREDSSNSDVKYARNKIRHEIIPALKELNPSVTETLIDNINRLKETETIYRMQIDEFKSKSVSREGDSLKINISTINELSFVNTLLFEILYEYGFNSGVVNDIVESLDGDPGKRFYSNTHRVIKDRDYLIITEVGDFKNHEYLVESSDSAITKPLKLKFEIKEIGIEFKYPTNPKIACLDLDKIQYPLIIRKWQQGDKFRPLGMKNFKKLSDFFTDNKFSIAQKENTWLLSSNSEIVWVIGHRIDDRFKMTDNTKSILMIS